MKIRVIMSAILVTCCSVSFAQLEVKDPAEFFQSQQNPTFSGPQVGETLPPFPFTGYGNKHTDQELEVLALAEGKPLLLFIQSEALQGMKGFERFEPSIIKPIQEKSDVDLRVITVFITDDRDQFEKNMYMILWNEDYQEVTQLGVSPDGRDGPGSYGLNRNVFQTILMVKDGKVLYNFPIPQPVNTPDPYVLGALADLIGEDRETLKQWINDGRSKRYEMMKKGKKGDMKKMKKSK